MRQESFMAFKEILVALTSYPEPTPLSVVDDAVRSQRFSAVTSPRYPSKPASRFPGTFSQTRWSRE
jgi:hypothetical protein